MGLASWQLSLRRTSPTFNVKANTVDAKKVTLINRLRNGTVAFLVERNLDLQFWKRLFVTYITLAIVRLDEITKTAPRYCLTRS